VNEDERVAKIKAAQEARAARLAAAGAAGAADAAGKQDEPGEEAPKPTMPNQDKLDRIVEIIKNRVAEDAVEEATINAASRNLPSITVKNEHWKLCSTLLRDHEELKFDFLRDVTGIDQESHMEMVYHLDSLSTDNRCAVKIKTDREHPSVASATPVWATANWQEREAYDLLGIDFPGHPDLRRIMMSDDWVGHPLRKDYVPLDPEV
jgi:NADH-quinone oxidoreductase subunit C